MELYGHNFYESFMVSISYNSDLKSKPNYGMNPLNNELINKTFLFTGGQKV